MDVKEILTFQDLEQYCISDDFNRLYKVPYRGGVAFLKVYSGSQSWWHYFHGTIKRYFKGLTSYMPAGRRRTELACFNTWRAYGIQVFKVYENVEITNLAGKSYALLEFCPAEMLTDYLQRTEVPLAAKLAKYAKLMFDWHRRHQLALETGNPLLTHNNGGIKHVMLLPDDAFLYFDFEMTIRSHRPERIKIALVDEIIKHLKYTALAAGADWPHYVKATVENYPDHALLEAAVVTMFQHPNHLMRQGRVWQSRSKDGRKPFSKYRVVADLARALASPVQAAVTAPGVQLKQTKSSRAAGSTCVD